ncbi:MAG: helix-turn-helix transcriptional regulator [Clostridia bacterium]|nr:helix-turn-helix transcriptional regulator [Clostridia bacterium]
MFENIKLSKELSRLNLSFSVDNIALKTYWCRAAIKEIKTFMNKQHAHSFFEIHLCIKGSAEFILNNEKLVLHEGEFIFIPKKMSHQIVKISEDFVKLVWGFNAKSEKDKTDADYNKLLIIRKLSQYIVASYTPNTLNILYLLFHNLDEKKIGWYSMVKQHLYEIFVEIVRCLIDKNNLLVEGDNDDHKVRMDAIAPYIMDNMANGITITELAREFAISERQLSRICNREYGMSAGEYIRSLQMEEAKHLLGDFDLSIADVANKVGYADYYAFCKAFKRMEGLSPAKFRLSLLK